MQGGGGGQEGLLYSGRGTESLCQVLTQPQCTPPGTMWAQPRVSGAPGPLLPTKLTRSKLGILESSPSPPAQEPRRQTSPAGWELGGWHPIASLDLNCCSLPSFLPSSLPFLISAFEHHSLLEGCVWRSPGQMASTSGMKRAAADAGGEELQWPDYVWKADETKL